MTKAARRAAPKDPVLLAELHFRLAELEDEIRRYPERLAKERALKAVEQPSRAEAGGEKVVTFSIGAESFAVGRSDVTFSDSNHARGTRHLRLYHGGKLVLHIEGDFEDQQMGSNFRFQTIQAFETGSWEKPFIKLSDQLRAYREKRRLTFQSKRDALRRR